MGRVRALERADLPAAARARFDQIADDRGEVPWLFRFMLSSPELTYRVSHVGDFLRAYSSLPDDLREMVILQLSRRLDFQLEWSYHEDLARSAGVPGPVIDALREGRTPPLDERQMMVSEFADAVLEHHLTDEAFAGLERVHGTAFAVDLVTLVAFIAFMQHLVDAFDIELPDGVVERLPIDAAAPVRSPAARP